MASSEDMNLNTACFRGRSKAQMLLGKILDTFSAAAPPPNSQHIRRQGLEGESLVGRNEGKRGLLIIDLNVAPPEDADCEFTAAEDGGNGQEILPLPPPPSAADVAPDGEEVGVEVETKMRWIALLEIAENALLEKEEEEIRKRKRGASQEAELGGELLKGAATRKKISGQRRQSLVAKWNDENEAAAVVRSSRGRAVAMPNKYRDSVLGAVAMAEADLPRCGKSATVFSTKRKSR